MFKKSIVLFLLIGFSIFVLPSESKAAVNEPNAVVKTAAPKPFSAIQRYKKKRWLKKRWMKNRRNERRNDRRNDRRNNRRNRRN
jgi:rRNA maturation protein Nop10